MLKRQIAVLDPFRLPLHAGRMIGPHEGKELELMLAGQKHLAIFYDVVFDPFENSEEIIPEEKFRPHVLNGTFIRHEKDFQHDTETVRYICFTTPGQGWRAQAFYHFHEEAIAGRRPFDDAYEYFIGRLLGYSEADIADFLKPTGLRTVS